MTNYIDKDQILQLHQLMIKRYGGSDGVRDWGLIESALARPAASFGGHDAYPETFEKAAVLLHSLIKNHGFIDGNKRTATAALGVFLLMNANRLTATDRELVEMSVNAANDELDEKAIVDWLKDHTKPV